MKRKLILSLLIASVTLIHNISYSQNNQQWKWVHPLPQGNTINWVKAFSSTEWIAVGDNGTFMKTTNAGASWDIYTNAGGTASATRQGKNLYKAWFFNLSTGIVCGSNGWVAKTTNGGINWDSAAVPASSFINMSGIYFINNTTGFVAGGAYIFKTTDAGLTWITLQNVSGSVRDIYAIDENSIYYVYSNYFAKTSNGGANWTNYAIGMSGPNDALFINSNTGFVCGIGGYIAISTNAGVNWTLKPIFGSTSYNCLFYTYLPYGNTFSENFSGTTFPPSGWRKVNVLGSSIEWVRSTTAPYSAPASALIINDCNISTGGGLDWLISPQIHINSNDSLSFWMKPLLTGFTDSLCVRISTTDTALSHFNTRVLYIADGAGYPNSSVWTNYKVSLNSFAGQNIYIGFKHQDMCGDGIFLDDVSVISPSVQSIRLYAVGDTNNIYTSSNMGDNWFPIPCIESSQYKSVWYSMDMIGSTIILGGFNGIFNVSVNSGANWTAKNSRVTNSSYYDVWCTSGTGKLWAVGNSSSQGASNQVLYSPDGGLTFQTQNVSNSAAQYISISMVNENTGYICGNISAVRRTINGGQTWDSLFTPIPAENYLNNVEFVNANTGWVFSGTNNPGGSIWKTTNGGLIWIQQTLIADSAKGRVVVAADMINENTGFCGSGDGKVHMTTNSGINWISKTPSLFTEYPRSLFMVSGNGGYICGNGKVYKTTNGWTNYDSVAMPIASPYNTYHATAWLDMNNGFVSCSGYVLKTTNGGIEWELMPTSSNIITSIYAVAIDTAYVVGAYGNILKLGRGLVGNIKWKNAIPSQYYLGQNYPNPFNPVTEFKFGLFKKGKVNLKVYDITGRLVQTYFDNIELNAGTITVKFDGSNLASGVYFYSLFVDDNRIDTKKMMLIK